jgi:hypothetical protein
VPLYAGLWSISGRRALPREFIKGSLTFVSPSSLITSRTCDGQQVLQQHRVPGSSVELVATTPLDDFLARTSPRQFVRGTEDYEILPRLKDTIGELNEVLSHIDPAELNEDVLEALRKWLGKLLQNARGVAKGRISSSGFSISVAERLAVGIDFLLE